MLLHHVSSMSDRMEESTARFAGLFDIFPESYWARFSTLEEVGLRCCLRSPARLRLIRRQVDGSGKETLLEEVNSSGGEVVLRTGLAKADAPESCLLLEIQVENPGANPLITAAWETACRPQRSVRVGIAITTFNREPFLIANLTRLCGRMAGGRAIVVNHGAPGLQDRLRDRLPPIPQLRWIDQENSGGAGGFTRGMVEHHTAGDITHVLLMDDDIDLPDDLVERLTAILSFTHSQVCLGGAMFDYHHRTRLFSAGDTLLPGSFGIGHVAPPEGCDIATPSGVDFLARVHRPDFNGWWCFAFPVAALDQVGLPMPCFIRGDDVEFGYRLKQAGMPTLGWPGLAVWHMPFADKSAPWHMFYDRRNSLFANARHRRIGRLAAIGKLIGGFTHHLLRYDYDRVRAMTMGIAAFNAGAAAMARWNHRDHAALIAATSLMDNHPTPALQEQNEPPSRRLAGFARSLRMVARLIADLTGLPVRTGSLCRMPSGQSWRPDFAHRPALAIECDSQGRATRLYRRNPRECRRATLFCLKAMIGMAVHFHQNVPPLSVGIRND